MGLICLKNEQRKSRLFLAVWVGRSKKERKKRRKNGRKEPLNEITEFIYSSSRINFRRSPLAKNGRCRGSIRTFRPQMVFGLPYLKVHPIRRRQTSKMQDLRKLFPG
ncbi:hypothetical protein TNCV_1382201 [Trichonephila clavipes]|nr:hypothetical protein TNCV_1382201 [Trichonephila clavipes]